MSYRYENLYIMHYGVGHDKGGHSGRYPWGSGLNPYSSGKKYREISKLLPNGLTQTEATARIESQKHTDYVKKLHPEYSNELLDELFNNHLKYERSRAAAELNGIITGMTKHPSLGLTPLELIKYGNRFVDTIEQKRIDDLAIIKKYGNDPSGIFDHIEKQYKQINVTNH